MKTSLILSTLIAIMFMNLNMSNAQNQSLCASNVCRLVSAKTSFTPKEPLQPVDVAPYYRKELIAVDAENGFIQLNYELPVFTNAATFQIQDFTGRTLKSFNVNSLNASINEFQIADLLSGTYKYVLLVDNQKKIAGEFTLNDY